MTKTFATELVDALLRMDRDLIRVVRRLDDELDGEERKHHKLNVARVVTYLSKALDDVVEDFPELRPAGKDP